VITLERRRGAASTTAHLLDLGAHDCDVARMIAGRFFLLVVVSCSSSTMMSRDLQWGEDRAARTDHDPRASRMDLVPFVVRSPSDKMAVQHRNHFVRLGKSTLKRSNVWG